MNAPAFSPSKVTVNMDPMDLSAGDREPESGERAILWMVRTADGMVGPVSVELIERGLNLGKVPEDAQVAPEGSDAWRPVRSVIQEETAIEVEPEAKSEPVVAKVVSIGQAEVQWPASFAPQAPPAPQFPQAMPVPARPAPMQNLPQPLAQQPLAQQPLAPQPLAQQPQWPAQQPSFQGEEPITIPTKSMSPALIAFGATLAVSAFVAAGIAIIGAL